MLLARQWPSWSPGYLFLLDHCGPVDMGFSLLLGEVVDLVMFHAQVCHSFLQLPDAAGKER